MKPVQLFYENDQFYALKTFTITDHLVELDILTRLQHPHLIGAIKVIPWDHQVGVILPLGRWSLTSMISRNPLTSTETITLLWQMATALCYLHQHGLVHRQINPCNFIVRGAGDNLRLLLADYSHAIYLDGQPIEVSSPNHPNYQSPELKEVSSCSPHHDWWALGIIYLEILTGRPIDSGEILDKNPTDRLEMLLQLLPAKYSDAVDLLIRLLEDNPSNRISGDDVLRSNFFISRLNLPTVIGRVRSAHLLATLDESLPVESKWVVVAVKCRLYGDEDISDWLQVSQLTLAEFNQLFQQVILDWWNRLI